MTISEYKRHKLTTGAREFIPRIPYPVHLFSMFVDSLAIKTRARGI
jgi:hypothetical protein